MQKNTKITLSLSMFLVMSTLFFSCTTSSNNKLRNFFSDQQIAEIKTNPINFFNQNQGLSSMQQQAIMSSTSFSIVDSCLVASFINAYENETKLQLDSVKSNTIKQFEISVQKLKNIFASNIDNHYNYLEISIVQALRKDSNEIDYSKYPQIFDSLDNLYLLFRLVDTTKTYASYTYYDIKNSTIVDDTVGTVVDTSDYRIMYTNFHNNVQLPYKNRMNRITETGVHKINTNKIYIDIQTLSEQLIAWDSINNVPLTTIKLKFAQIAEFQSCISSNLFYKTRFKDMDKHFCLIWMPQLINNSAIINNCADINDICPTLCPPCM